MNESSFKKFFHKVSPLDKSNFYEYLSVMLDGWVTLSEALNTVKTKIKNPFFLEKLKELQTYINSWDSLNKAMKKIPDAFESSEHSIIEAWEQSWTLVKSLTTLWTDFKKWYELKQKVKWAMTYPIIIIVFLIVAVIIVMTYVVPKLVPLFAEMWVNLPLATRSLIWTSNFITNNFTLLIWLFLVIIFFIFAYIKTDEWRKSYHKLLLKSPLIWEVYRNYILCSVSSNLWTLMWWWVPIIKSLLLVWKSTNNGVYEELFEQIAQEVWKWQKIVDSMIKTDETWDYFPTDFVQMLSVWEKTASMEKITKKLNDHFIKEVDYALTNMTKWIEPIAIALAWAFILWFAFAIFGAILDLTASIG